MDERKLGVCHSEPACRRQACFGISDKEQMQKQVQHDSYEIPINCYFTFDF